MALPGREKRQSEPFDVIVVLGCRVVKGRPSRALSRRLRRAQELCRVHPDKPIIMSGGKAWNGVQESSCMAQWWHEEGLSSERLWEEAESMTTRENARYVAELCERLGYRHIALVTCDYHVKRAQRLFLSERLKVTAVPAQTQLTRWARWRVTLREWGADILGRIQAWFG